MFKGVVLEDFFSKYNTSLEAEYIYYNRNRFQA